MTSLRLKMTMNRHSKFIGTLSQILLNDSTNEDALTRKNQSRKRPLA